MSSNEGGAMLGMRVGRGRSVALGICLALALLLFAAAEAKAGEQVAPECGCTLPQGPLLRVYQPLAPLDLAVEGGEGWRRSNSFDLHWSNPPRSQSKNLVAGASLRIFGPGGYDTGKLYTPGFDLSALPNLRLPAPGVYTAQVTLRDTSGYEATEAAGSVTLRLDDVPPTVAFVAPDGGRLSDTVVATVSDAHSGPAAGEVRIRRLGADGWARLASRLDPGSAAGVAQLVATLPAQLEPATYVVRADLTDVAGNSASATLQAAGGREPLESDPALSERMPGPRAGRRRSKTRLFARLRWRRRRGPRIAVPFRAAATLTGRLVNADGAGLAGRRLRIVSRPSRGALARRQADTVSTGSHGGFRLPLPSGPSRRITVSFAGDAGLAASRRPALALRVRGAVSLHAAPRALRTGESVRLWGRVRARGAPLPRRGKLVAIQYYEQGARRWRPVLVVRSDHGGRFRAAYRFRYVSGSAAIRLRAVALAEERWPYAPGASRPSTVRVSGQ
jgi:hypothetical protein